MAHSFKRKDYGSWEVWRKSYSEPELVRRYNQLARSANNRILRLERAGIIGSHDFDIITEFLKVRDRKRFREKIKDGKVDIYELKTNITVLENFLAMEQSTVGGYRKKADKRIQKFMEKGISEDVARDPRFYDFLNSNTFNILSKHIIDSDKIVDFYARAYDDGLSVEEIEEAFKTYTRKNRHWNYVKIKNDLKKRALKKS